MRRGFARVKWLPCAIGKGLRSSQDLGERRIVEGFLPGSARFLRNPGRAGIPSQQGTTWRTELAR